MDARRPLGVETEYALTARRSDGTPIDAEATMAWLMKLAKRRLRHLRDTNSTGMFLENSMRFYVDSGLHPEMSTPECTDPREVVRYVLAGERILTRLAAELAASVPEVAEVMVLKCNVDYSGARSTWGCHESYLHRVDPQLIPGQILPHLVTRIVYTGAGGFNAISRNHEFLLSPRVPHLVRTVSAASTQDRGIFHTKDESLSAEGYHRLHVLSGESLCSELGSWLKIGATALVVVLVEAGLRPGDAVQLASPLAAMRRFARDETCSVAARGAGGKHWTALAVQRHYQQLAARHLDEPFMPEWARELVPVWGAMLDRLEQGAPDSVATTLDWGIKLSLYRDWARQRGQNWSGPRPPAALRSALFETDARFGQLGETSIFAAMDGAGVLDHHVPGIERVDEAIRNPPVEGRAFIRGKCIKRLAGEGERYGADWVGISDSKTKRYLDLSDPFEEKERWQSAESEQRRTRRIRLQELVQTLRPRRDTCRTPDGFSVGDRVVLGQPAGAPGPESACSDAVWVPDMDRYVGRTATIINIVHVGPGSGHSLVNVDVDGGRWAWRTQYLRRASSTSSAPF